MKVKLLKRIRKRFCVVDITNEKVKTGCTELILFDNKYCNEERLRVAWYHNQVEACLMEICMKLDSRFYSFSRFYESKLEKRRKRALRKKYFPFQKK